MTVFEQKSSSSSNPAGFTLVELLVVLAIIAVLVMLGFAGVAELRGKSQAVGCISRQRQLGIYINLYADDNNNTLPPGHVKASTNYGISNLTVWTTFLINSSRADLGYVLTNLNNPKSIFICPSTVMQTDDPVFKRNRATWGTDYGLNVQVFPTTLASSPSIKATKRSALSSSTILLFDGNQQADASMPQNHYARHSGKIHYLFADNHVEAFAEPPKEDKYWKPN